MWAFSQAKHIRQTVLSVALRADSARDRPRQRPAALKARLAKTVADWKKTVARYNTDASVGKEGRKELAEKAKEAEHSAT